MNRIETAVSKGAEDLVPLETVNGISPALTPALFVVLGGLAVAFAVGCAEGHCAQNPGEAIIPCTSDMDQMSVGDLLQARRQAI